MRPLAQIYPPANRCTLAADAKSPPQALGADASGVRNATSGSWTDRLTREHRMTLEEAYLVLNAKREDGAAGVLRVGFFFLLFHSFHFFLGGRGFFVLGPLGLG